MTAGVSVSTPASGWRDGGRVDGKMLGMAGVWTAVTATLVLIAVGAALASGWPPGIVVAIAAAVAVLVYLLLRAVMPRSATSRPDEPHSGAP